MYVWSSIGSMVCEIRFEPHMWSVPAFAYEVHDEVMYTQLDTNNHTIFKGDAKAKSLIQIVPGPRAQSTEKTTQTYINYINNNNVPPTRLQIPHRPHNNRPLPPPPLLATLPNLRPSRIFRRSTLRHHRYSGLHLAPPGPDPTTKRADLHLADMHTLRAHRTPDECVTGGSVANPERGNKISV
jgi:hypothetical protein